MGSPLEYRTQTISSDHSAGSCEALIANTLLSVDPDGHATALRQALGEYDTYPLPSPDGHHLAFLEYTNAA